MKKTDIQERIQAIDARLNEFPALCEKEQRKLTEAEEKEKNNLITERGDLQRQLKEIETGEQRGFQGRNGSGEEKRFNLIEEIRNIYEGGMFQGAYAERMMDKALNSHLDYNKGKRTILMEASAPERRALNGILTGSDNYTSNSKNGGLEMVRTDVLPIIEAIYNFTVLDRAGANFYNGLVGNAKIPVMSNIKFGFKSENASADKVTPTMSKVELTPHRLTGEIRISNQLIYQTSEDLEARLRISISKAVAEALEVAILADGSSPHSGLMYGATTVALGSTTYDTVLELAEAMYGINYTPTFVLDPKAARFLKQKVRLSGGLEAIMSGGRVDDEPTFITNSIKGSTTTSGYLACADFSRLHIGTWGDLLEITVDPLTLAGDGMIRLVLNYYCDWGWDAANGTGYASREITNA